MKYLFLILALSASINLWAKDSCELDNIGLTQESDIAERLFYEGTCHFRNKDYDQSVILWRKLSTLDIIDQELKELQISSLNNLGYLLFFGYGTEENKQKALAHWHKAVSLGHDEAEYHLCHAYADKKEPTYDQAKALLHCYKAKSIYQSVAVKSEDDDLMLKQIINYLSQLKK
ncbi:hypothetical protein [Aliikangiella sp. IMCC44359]|uniref:hypothetical protein n=1 Tax=Aliikangiella sp. IMCC44359 TaxID=3459125 RepID=UPI00403A8187